jgi:hypothetical protein
MRYESYGRRTTDVAVCERALMPKTIAQLQSFFQASVEIVCIQLLTSALKHVSYRLHFLISLFSVPAEDILTLDPT